jgi:hypothetical protein
MRRLIFVGLVLCCFLPFVEILWDQNKKTQAALLAATGVALTTLYQIATAYGSERSGHELQGSSTQIESRVRALTTDLAALREHVASLGLDRAARDDASEAGIAWQLIHTATDAETYSRYVAEYPDSPYATEAKRRHAAICRWTDVVDKADPIDIHFFRLTGLFDALRVEAGIATLEAQTRMRQLHRDEFWRHFARRFVMLLPFAVVLYALVLSVPFVAYGLTHHGLISPYFALAAESITMSLSSRLPALPPQIAEQVRHGLPYVQVILRGLASVVILFGGAYLVQVIAEAIDSGYIKPVRDRIHTELDRIGTDGARFPADGWLDCQGCDRQRPLVSSSKFLALPVIKDLMELTFLPDRCGVCFMPWPHLGTRTSIPQTRSVIEDRLSLFDSVVPIDDQDERSEDVVDTFKDYSTYTDYLKKAGFKVGPPHERILHVASVSPTFFLQGLMVYRVLYAVFAPLTYWLWRYRRSLNPDAEFFPVNPFRAGRAIVTDHRLVMYVDVDYFRYRFCSVPLASIREVRQYHSSIRIQMKDGDQKTVTVRIGNEVGPLLRALHLLTSVPVRAPAPEWRRQFEAAGKHHPPKV